MTTRLQEKYGPYLMGMGGQLQQIVERLGAIDTLEDLYALGRQLELCQELVGVIIQQWTQSIILFGAAEEWQDDECPFHFRDYKPKTCSVCRTAQTSGKMIAA